MTICAPGPRGSVLWGSLSEFRRDALGLLSRSVQDHGDIVRLRFGPVIAHIVNHPDYVEQVLSRNAARYDKNTRSADRISATCGDSLLSANRQAWERHRRLIQPVFQPRHLGGLDDIVDAKMEPLMDRWRKVAAVGGEIDIVSEMMTLAISISAKALFSSDVDAERIEAALAVLLDDTWRRLEALVDLSMISDALHRPAFKQARGAIDDIVFDIIKARKTGSDTPNDLLSLLISAHEAEGVAKLSDKELRDAAVTLLLSGHETTANALAWALHLLGKHPDMNPNIVGVENFFAETIRLYPSIWIIERRAIEAQEIGGYHIPRGTSVLISPYLMHRNREFWQEPEVFNPTRFTPEQTAGRPRHAYIPFGLGPHRCVGIYMAKAISTRVIKNINENFRLQEMPGQIPQIFPGITLRHKIDFKMLIEAI